MRVKILNTQPRLYLQYTSTVHFKFSWSGTLQSHDLGHCKHTENFLWLGHPGISPVFLSGNSKFLYQLPNPGHCKHTIQETMNVLGIFWAGNTAKENARKILNVFAVYWVDTTLVHYPFLCSVSAMSWVRKLDFSPSDNNLLGFHQRTRGTRQTRVRHLEEREIISRSL